ncbi:HAMP domain-containing histidine kinase [Chitinophaga filiformis]|uniref:sensor histidine kinase n=1 Tax=Chitinophaga filiformis TaxID=104663 RepID=UPI001F376048|nr:HAMP domain-containing sensor histidine kinase [Chitinophaga filiformis]MCF6402764.1 HAMP domain-containing histidine kinase [Chitinophaga filiformis]MCF6403318.1 HAMP domain-containing histidine kinase [Chitinophaga filiformis]
MDSTHTSESSTLLNNASNVLAITAHEFKTPLTTITSIVDLVSAKLRVDRYMNPFYEQQLSRITSEIFSLNNMLDEMLTINNILSGSFEATKELLYAEEQLLPLKEQFRSLTDDNRTLQINLSGTPCKILANSGQLTRIFTNLVSNAFKFSRENPPVVHLSYEEKALVITVSDDGIGIPAEDLPHLFQPYYRGSNTGGIAGTGLGLTIVKTFVTANDGEITVSSEPDKGTVFTLVFRYPDTCQ